MTRQQILDKLQEAYRVGCDLEVTQYDQTYVIEYVGLQSLYVCIVLHECVEFPNIRGMQIVERVPKSHAQQMREKAEAIRTQSNAIALNKIVHAIEEVASEGRSSLAIRICGRALDWINYQSLIYPFSIDVDELLEDLTKLGYSMSFNRAISDRNHEYYVVKW